MSARTVADARPRHRRARRRSGGARTGFRNDGDYSVARLFRDAHGAALMVHNDRINAHTAQLILVQKGGTP